MSPGSGPGPRFPGSGLREPGDPVPDADPGLIPWAQVKVRNQVLSLGMRRCPLFRAAETLVLYRLHYVVYIYELH